MCLSLYDAKEQIPKIMNTIGISTSDVKELCITNFPLELSSKFSILLNRYNARYSSTPRACEAKGTEPESKNTTFHVLIDPIEEEAFKEELRNLQFVETE
jgi:hypothetical protein